MDVVEVTPPGLPAEVWDSRIQQAPALTAADLVSSLGLADRRPQLLIAGAHPDDETIGAGRLANVWAHRIGPVSTVAATAGEACFDHVGPRPDGLSDLRLREWELASTRLGIGSRHCLGLPDGHLGGRLGDLSDALCSDLDRCLRSAGRTDDTVVIAAPWPSDPHPDHQAVGAVAAQLAAAHQLPLLHFPVWMTYWMPPTDPVVTSTRLTRLIVDESVDATFRDACGIFTSQLEPFRPGWGPVVPPAMMGHQRHQLLLGEVHPAAPPSHPGGLVEPERPPTS